jgi:hypothetical protein
LLLFTDGLVERRDEHLDEGLERLRAAVAGRVELDSESLCDLAVEVCLSGRTRADDVCVLAVHRV